MKLAAFDHALLYLGQLLVLQGAKIGSHKNTKNPNYVFHCFFYVFLQVRSLTTVTGKAVGGSLPAPMNSLVTTENTQATALSSASAVTEPSPGRTTLPYT